MQNIKLIAVASALIASLALTGCDKPKDAQAEPAPQTTEAPAMVDTPAPTEEPLATDASQTKGDVAQPAAATEDAKTADQLAAHPAEPDTQTDAKQPADTQPTDAAKTK